MGISVVTAGAVRKPEEFGNVLSLHPFSMTIDA